VATPRPTYGSVKPALGTKQPPWGPKGSTTPPHNRRSVSPSRGGGPPSATQRCNYCDSQEHFWRNCPKRQADGVDTAGHDALVKKCLAMEESEELKAQAESSSFKAVRGREGGPSREHSPEKGSSRGGESTSEGSTSEADSQELNTDAESDQG